MAANKPIVIAHRGASGYLPEHTAESKSLAHAMGADFLEQDVVLTRDGVPIVLHDIYLDTTTNVVDLFPARARADGRYYALDFDLTEINQLSAHERSVIDGDGQRRAVYPKRFPLDIGGFRVHTLAHEIDLISGLDHSSGKTTGLYTELKAPNWHLAQGYDLAVAVLAILEEKNYAQRTEQVFLQCFDSGTLKRLRNEFNCPLPLIQLIGENSWAEDASDDYDYLRSPAGLAEIALYAQGIGPWINHVLIARNSDAPNSLINEAHRLGLLVHPYTLRRDDLPPGVESLESLMTVLVDELEVDGLFTDFPDVLVKFLQTRCL